MIKQFGIKLKFTNMYINFNKLPKGFLKFMSNPCINNIIGGLSYERSKHHRN